MLYFSLFIYIFVILVGLYLVLHIKKLSKYDISILGIATVVLLLYACQCQQQSTYKEHFSNIDVENVLEKYKQMDLEEDISDIQNKLVVYLTVFNKTSFNNMGKTWNNIAKIKTDGTCDAGDNSSFTFEMAPVFSRRNGLYLGNNRMVGPLSSAIGIQFHNTFTIVFACKHGNLLVDHQNSEIELIKLYANSPNNNGLSLFIQKGSVQNDNNTQTGTLMLQYANTDPHICKVDKDHSYINFDKDILTFYYIVKDTDNVRVLMMNENSNVIVQILKFTITNTDINFSNKEIVINRLLNWNGNMFNTAVYDRALSDEQVSNFYTHCMNEYLKNIDPNFIKMLDQYNDTLRVLRDLLKCPYDKTVCEACQSVTKWSDITQVLSSPLQCKKSINDFCANNTINPLCKCWDTSSSIYKTENCRIYRSIFSGERTSAFESLTAEDLDYIKNKYGLIYPHECPTLIKKPNFIQNTYQKYDWNKLKVYLDTNDRSTGPDRKIRNVYPDEDDKDNENSDEWTNRHIKVHGIDQSQVNNHDLSVTNYFKTDPQLNKDISSTPMMQQSKMILDQAKSEQKQQLNGSTGLINNQPVKLTQVQDPITLPKQDTFFTKFMKVVIP